jgi:hypothetical protein
LETTTPELEDLRRLMVRMSGGTRQDMGNRTIVCTPCGGCYERVLYWLIVANGSPPRGTMLFDTDDGVPRRCTYIDEAGHGRKMGRRQTAIVERFFRRYLADVMWVKGAKPVLVEGGAWED